MMFLGTLFSHVRFSLFSAALQDIPICFQAPTMNCYIERFIGSFKREALDRFVLVNQTQIEYITKEYVRYYNTYRPHQGIGTVPIPSHETGELFNPLSKKPSGKVRKKEFLSGVLNHYFLEPEPTRDPPESAQRTV